ncbi:hypothetical protein BAOM_4809 [Peribacillus asahii]|uniref:Uncharacterized protein n=1 Tax=Peribacillus asahii TaxID=228899 RepID=A0A3T0KYJ1_9BACI|nr:hypothetical protein BAOM_4809 [Peribacillus asahii]
MSDFFRLAEGELVRIVTGYIFLSNKEGPRKLKSNWKTVAK